MIGASQNGCQRVIVHIDLGQCEGAAANEERAWMVRLDYCPLRSDVPENVNNQLEAGQEVP